MSMLKMLLGVSLLFAESCKKDLTSSEPVLVPPTNLVVTANVSADGSGNVTINATANNAVSYTFDFGDGESITQGSGSIEHKYLEEGLHAYTIRVTAISSSGLKISKTTDVTITVTAPVPVLFWSDEFNVDGVPDQSKWVYDIGTGLDGWGNQELEYYTDRVDNVVVEGGLLKIKALKENYNASSYTSARIKSLGKFQFKYGVVKVGAKMPVGIGTWPAIWMLGADINTVGWPACGEIDIMEHLGRDLNKIYGTVHYPGRSGGNPVSATTVISNATTAFHEYKLEWSSKYIKFYVDDTLFHTVNNSTAVPFNKDFFFLINLAMGGAFGGSVDPAFTNATMEVDYIRLYK